MLQSVFSFYIQEYIFAKIEYKKTKNR